MVAEPWIFKMGNQVSSSLKHALYFDSSSNKKQGTQERKFIGILSFEVANVMSKIMNLHKSLTDQEILKLKNEIFNSKGVKALVSSDSKHLLELALFEKLDDLNRIAGVVSRLGKKCTVPALQGFEHVYGDIINGVIDIKELGFLVKDMESMMRKMERYVSSTVSLYSEMKIMSELEIATKKFQQNQLQESRKAFEQKLLWQKQDVRHLKNVSLWNETYDKVVELLARTVCTVYARVYVVFGDGCLRGSSNTRVDVVSKVQKETSLVSVSTKRATNLRPKVPKSEGALFGPEDFNFVCGIGPGRLFMECLSLSSSNVDDDDDQSSQISGANDPSTTNSMSGTRPKSTLLVHGYSNTVGASALAFHYANIIIIIEKLLLYPHLVGDEARDNLYHMLPTSLRKSLKSKLKSCSKNFAIYDAPLAHDWREVLDEMLKWLAPLAHNMIRWQSERNFEQQQIVTRKNVLLLETLYFADQEKTEEAICELLVGLNYICRYERQQNALLDCTSSFDYEDCMRWQLQARDSFHP